LTFRGSKVLVGLGFSVAELSENTDKPQSKGILWTRNRLVAETST